MRPDGEMRPRTWRMTSPEYPPEKRPVGVALRFWPSALYRPLSQWSPLPATPSTENVGIRRAPGAIESIIVPPRDGVPT